MDILADYQENGLYDINSLILATPGFFFRVVSNVTFSPARKIACSWAVEVWRDHFYICGGGKFWEMLQEISRISYYNSFMYVDGIEPVNMV